MKRLKRIGLVLPLVLGISSVLAFQDPSMLLEKAIYAEETLGNLNDAIGMYQQVLRRGKEIDLTPKEFGLLALFVKRTGCALTRDEILKRVWGYDILVTARSVDRCVNTLRNKIEENPQAPLFIKTVRDVGYRFES